MEDLQTALQYSVTPDWRTKVRNAIKTLRENFPAVERLVYVTIQIIGPAADDLRSELRLKGIDLDIHDTS